MSEEVLDEVIRQYLRLGFPVSVFSWQGGEPTLRGLPFFEKVVRFQKKYGSPGQVVSNSLQTNGMLIDDKWGKFFSRYKFFIGLSLDGPAGLHNLHRGNSHEKAVKAAKTLSRNQVEFNLLSVITRDGEERAKELLHWFLENGFYHLQFIPCLEPGARNRGIAPFSISPERYGSFLCELFDAWWECRDRGTTVRTFESVLETLLYGNTHLCVFSPRCPGYMVIEHDGSVYPCDFFVRENTLLGNLRGLSLAGIYESRAYREFRERKTPLDDACRRCEWLAFCHGGCQKDRITKDGESAGKTYFCPSYKKFFSHSMKRFKTLAEQIKGSKGLRV